MAGALVRQTILVVRAIGYCLQIRSNTSKMYLKEIKSIPLKYKHNLHFFKSE